MKPTVLFVWALLLAGSARAADERPEVLLGFGTELDAEQVTFVVASSGCTARKDFRGDFTNGTLTLFRNGRDSCKAMPHRVTIAFTLKELGISPHQPFALGNRIAVNENLTGR